MPEYLDARKTIYRDVLLYFSIKTSESKNKNKNLPQNISEKRTLTIHFFFTWPNALIIVLSHIDERMKSFIYTR